MTDLEVRLCAQQLFGYMFAKREDSEQLIVELHRQNDSPDAPIVGWHAQEARKLLKRKVWPKQRESRRRVIAELSNQLHYICFARPLPTLEEERRSSDSSSAA